MFAPLLFALALTANPLSVPDPAIAAGEVRVGPSLVRKFVFTNAGTEPLTITDVRSSCGCLAPTLTKRTLEPGERGELTVEVNTLSQPAGPHRWTFSLAYRCGSVTGECPLELTASLTQEIEISPAAIAFHGDGQLSTTIKVVDRRPHPFAVKIDEIASSSPYLAIEFYVADLKPGAFAFGVRVRHDCPEGRHAATITIPTTDPDYREIKLPVTIDRELKRRVKALPSRATLVAGGSVVVQLQADEPLQVESVDPSVSALTCRWAAGPGNRTTLRIGLDRSKWDGKPFSGAVRVLLNAPAGETVVIPVSVRADE